MSLMKLKLYSFCLRVKFWHGRKILKKLSSTHFELRMTQYMEVLASVAQIYHAEGLPFVVKISDAIMKDLFPDRETVIDLALYNEYHKFIEDQTDIIRKSEDFTQRELIYKQLVKYYYSQTYHSKFDHWEWEGILGDILKYSRDESLPIIDLETVNRHEQKIANEKHAITAEWENLKKILHETETEKTRIRIDASNMDFVFLASFTSALLLISSIIYSYIFYGYFGVNILNYFELTDYISGCLDKIGIAVVSILFSVFFDPDPILSDIEDQYTYHLNESSSVPGYIVLCYCIYILMVVIWIPLAFLKNNASLLIPTIFLSLVVLGSYISNRIGRVFLQGRRVSLLLRMSSLMVVVFSLYAVVDIQDVNEHGSNEYHFIFAKGAISDEHHLTFLGTNGNFFFFYDTSMDKSVVVPGKQVLSVGQELTSRSIFNKWLNSFFPR